MGGGRKGVSKDWWSEGGGRKGVSKDWWKE